MIFIFNKKKDCERIKYALSAQKRKEKKEI
jgi:hypothetical protein